MLPCRDVGEDASQRNRIYVPLDELEQFGIAEEEVRTRQTVLLSPSSAAAVPPQTRPTGPATLPPAAC